jgi:hypothetical protein
MITHRVSVYIDNHFVATVILYGVTQGGIVKTIRHVPLVQDLYARIAPMARTIRVELPTA